MADWQVVIWRGGNAALLLPDATRATLSPRAEAAFVAAARDLGVTASSGRLVRAARPGCDLELRDCRLVAVSREDGAWALESRQGRRSLAANKRLEASCWDGDRLVCLRPECGVVFFSLSPPAKLVRGSVDFRMELQLPEGRDRQPISSVLVRAGSQPGLYQRMAEEACLAQLVHCLAMNREFTRTVNNYPEACPTAEEVRAATAPAVKPVHGYSRAYTPYLPAGHRLARYDAISKHLLAELRVRLRMCRLVDETASLRTLSSLAWFGVPSVWVTRSTTEEAIKAAFPRLGTRRDVPPGARPALLFLSVLSVLDQFAVYVCCVPAIKSEQVSVFVDALVTQLGEEDEAVVTAVVGSRVQDLRTSLFEYVCEFVHLVAPERDRRRISDATTVEELEERHLGYLRHAWTTPGYRIEADEDEPRRRFMYYLEARAAGGDRGITRGCRFYPRFIRELHAQWAPNARHEYDSMVEGSCIAREETVYSVSEDASSRASSTTSADCEPVWPFLPRAGGDEASVDRPPDRRVIFLVFESSGHADRAFLWFKSQPELRLRERWSTTLYGEEGGPFAGGSVVSLQMCGPYMFFTPVEVERRGLFSEMTRISRNACLQVEGVAADVLLRAIFRDPTDHSTALFPGLTMINQTDRCWRSDALVRGPVGGGPGGGPVPSPPARPAVHVPVSRGRSLRPPDRRTLSHSLPVCASLRHGFRLRRKRHHPRLRCGGEPNAEVRVPGDDG